MTVERRKPRAQRARRAVAVLSVATALSLAGVMAWNDANATSTKHVTAAPASSSDTSNGSSSNSSDGSYSSSDNGTYGNSPGSYGNSSSGSYGSSGSYPSSSGSASTVTPHTSTRGS